MWVAISTIQSSYAVGDKLKIAVFEQIGPQLSGRYLGASAVERTELSGEYTVQEDGNIYIPLVGPVAVAGELFRSLRMRWVRPSALRSMVR